MTAIEDIPTYTHHNTSLISCRRCGKMLNPAVDAFHTCSPSETYRAGILEGLKIAEGVNESTIRHLIKQYESEIKEK